MRSLALMEMSTLAVSGLTLAGAHHMILLCGTVPMLGQRLVNLALPMIALVILALNGRAVWAGMQVTVQLDGVVLTSADSGHTLAGVRLMILAVCMVKMLGSSQVVNLNADSGLLE